MQTKGGIYMVRRIINANGWIAYQMNDGEIECLLKNEKRLADCESCKTILSQEAYYVPVLDSFMCGECFRLWNIISKRYKYSEGEDDIEINKMSFFEKKCRQKNIPIYMDSFSENRKC